jgi:hypothetical protein
MKDMIKEKYELDDRDTVSIYVYVLIVYLIVQLPVEYSCLT